MAGNRWRWGGGFGRGAGLWGLAVGKKWEVASDGPPGKSSRTWRPLYKSPAGSLTVLSSCSQKSELQCEVQVEVQVVSRAGSGDHDSGEDGGGGGGHRVTGQWKNAAAAKRVEAGSSSSSSTGTRERTCVVGGIVCGDAAAAKATATLHGDDDFDHDREMSHTLYMCTSKKDSNYGSRSRRVWLRKEERGCGHFQEKN